MSLTKFLLTRIAEDEDTAKYVLNQWPPRGWTADAVARDERLPVWKLDLDERELMVQVHARRVLAECETKRQIVLTRQGLADAQHVHDPLGMADDVQGYTLDWVLKRLALPYADHDDFREEFRP